MALKRSRGLRSNRASVLVIVLITLLFTAAALTAFIEKAGNDLLVDAHEVDARRLRQEAFSALEVTLAVLEDFRQADNGLHGVAEGWGDPLGWAGWTPSEGRTVEVALQDESGKIPLPHADMTTLTNLFLFWQMPQADAERLADSMLGWMRNGYVYSTPVTPSYEQSPIPFDAPGRPLRSFSELAAVDNAKDFFFDENGRPNAYYWRFVADFSIFNYRNPNVNSANPDVLAAAGQYTGVQQQHINDYLAGTGQFAQEGPQWFKDTTTLASVAGLGGSATPFTTTITALRIIITVHEGKSQYHLSVVVSPRGGATLNQTNAVNATSGRTGASASTGGTITSQAAPSSTTATPSTAATVPQNINYPFTILELLENDQIPPASPPPAPSTS